MKMLYMLILLAPMTVKADLISDMVSVAQSNGYKPTMAVLEAIKEASENYQIDAMEMLAISLIETGGGNHIKTRHNKNGSFDIGAFQINTVNHKFCEEFNLNNVKGNAFCAAKLLKRIKTTHKNDKEAVARYHSSTKYHKDLYFGKIKTILADK